MDIQATFGVFARGRCTFFTFFLLVYDDNLGPDIPQSWIQAVVSLGAHTVSAHGINFTFYGLMLKQASVFANELLMVCGCIGLVLEHGRFSRCFSQREVCLLELFALDLESALGQWVCRMLIVLEQLFAFLVCKGVPQI